MAFMNQDKKKIIAANLKAVVPKDWKYSLSVKHHNAIVLIIKSAPIDLIKHALTNMNKRREHQLPVTATSFSVNEYHFDTQFTGEVLDIMNKIKTALNTDNHNRSDMMTDYFDVGHYIDIEFGRWGVPFVVTK